ncbi:hypothetical protein BGZ51_005049 [Haplosporangium sp. Z 767]|nr:hypothetical protein BGZ51_005049 [Haplosporangium sp. Z 767]KAF9182047.1 hypothetical protein BGZ50_005185 [Haplosporangium sp. Z 11]
MIIVKTTLLAAWLVVAASRCGISLATPLTSTRVDIAAILEQNAPLAKNLDGVHLLLDNDLDTMTPKHPVIFLSKPRSSQDSEKACASLGEKLVDPSVSNWTKLLSDTPVAENEVKRVRRLWVNNNNTTNCTALDRKTGEVLQLNCSMELPSLCSNSLPRTMADKPADKSKQILVWTPNMGVWQGYRDRNQFRFLGIPYAAPPVGQNRFLRPRRIDSRRFLRKTAVIVNNATEYGNACIQTTSFANVTLNETEGRKILGANQSEDCLYLNVFTPSLKSKNAKGLPVMVMVHGGGYSALAASSPVYEPGNLVSRGGVVVVSMNYRLNTFGLFENAPSISREVAPGNLAVRDQVAALQWVRSNIKAFGGDPSQVTIFGESAGGYSMRALLSAPSAFGLYKNVISQSDLMGLPFSSPKYSSGDLGNLTLQALGCDQKDLACAQNKTVGEIMAAQEKAVSQALNMTENQWIPSINPFRPTADRSFIPADFAELVRTGRYNREANILWGTTRDDAAPFLSMRYQNPIPLQDANTSQAYPMGENRTSIMMQSQYYKFNESDPDTVRDVFSNASTDFYFACPVQMMSRGVAARESEVYAYVMDHGRSFNLAFGNGTYLYDNATRAFCEGRVCHADDLIPTFGSGDVWTGIEQTGDDARFARQVIDRFTTFAKTGNPNPKEGLAGPSYENPDVTGVQWPAYNSSNPVFEFRLQNSTVTNNTDTEKCNWIAQNVQFDYQVHGPSGRVVPIFPPIPNPSNSSMSPSP